MNSSQKVKLTVKETTVFGILGAVIYLSKLIMEFLPNIHLVGVFVVAITVVYQKKALYPISVFILLEGLLNGFSIWWIPYLYIWFVLWGAVMILPKDFKSKKVKTIVLMCICAAHGFLYGTLYAPFQALAFGLSFKGTLAWIAAGLSFDAIHGVSNFICGILIVPISELLKRARI